MPLGPDGGQRIKKGTERPSKANGPAPGPHLAAAGMQEGGTYDDPQRLKSV